MAAHASTHGEGHDHEHSPMQYVKIYVILLVLFAISVAGPMLEIRVLTLITAFGIAIVKALMVAAYFMHLNIEKKFVWYMLFGMLLLVGVFFTGVATDIMKPYGRNWVNAGAQYQIDSHAHPTEHGGEHHK